MNYRWIASPGSERYLPESEVEAADKVRLTTSAHVREALQDLAQISEVDAGWIGTEAIDALAAAFALDPEVRATFDRLVERAKLGS